MKLQIIGFTLGCILVIIGLAQMVPAAIDWTDNHINADAFFDSGILLFFLGSALCLSNKSFSVELSVRHTFLLTTLSWITLGVSSSVPLYFSDLHLSFTDALFEAISGITTTGSSVLSGLDNMSRGILLWRSIISWLGGIGIVTFAIIILPFLKVGGMQLFQSESSDKSDKIMPRTSKVTASLLIVYASLTVLCILTYRVLGMSWFDAINHAFTSVSGCGYSTHDASYGHFDSYALDMAACVFMLAGAIPFVLFIKLLFKHRFEFFKDEQFLSYMLLLFVLISTMTLWLWLTGHYNLANSFRYTAFNIISVISTTGYATTDYTLWGPFAVMFFFIITYLGGCTGSTAGGIKIMRILIAAKALSRQVKHLIYPSGVFILKYQGKPIDRTVINPVLGFLCLYVVSNIVFTVLLCAIGLDFETAISGTATTFANTGPGIGDIVGPAGNFASLPDTAKWVFCVAMILGRLEILTVLVLITPKYWSK